MRNKIKYLLRNIVILAMIAFTIVSFCVPIYAEEVKTDSSVETDSGVSEEDNNLKDDKYNVNNSSQVEKNEDKIGISDKIYREEESPVIRSQENIVQSGTIVTSNPKGAVIKFFNPVAAGSQRIKVYKTATEYYTRPGLIALYQYDANSVLYSKELCYCIELSAPLSSNNLVTEDDLWHGFIPNERWKEISDILGYAEYGDGITVDTDMADISNDRWVKYFSTQLVIWYKLGQIDYDALVKNCSDGYGDLFYCNNIIMLGKYKNLAPSFTNRDIDSAECYKMTYNAATKKYEVILTDDNYYIDANGDKAYSSLTKMNINNQLGLEISKIDGNKLKITSDKPIGSIDNPVVISLTKPIRDGVFTAFGDYNIQSVAIGNVYARYVNSYFKIYTEDYGRLSVKKQDSITHRTLSNVEFGIYNDKECNNLVETITTDKNGYAQSSDLLVGTYYVKELKSKDNYVIDYSVRDAIVTSKEICNISIENTPIYGNVTIVKQDSMGTPREAASLAGAVYELYASADIYAADGSNTLLYSKKQLVISFPATDLEGKATIENIPVGTYYIKEKTPPIRSDWKEGNISKYAYHIDENTYEIGIDSSKLVNTTDTYVDITCNVEDKPILQSLRIVKFLDNTEVSKKLSLEGIGFSLYSYMEFTKLYPDIIDTQSGDIDFSKITDDMWEKADASARIIIGENGEQELYTDEFGALTTVPLYVGKYILRETTYPENIAYPIQDVIDIAVYDKNNNVPDIYTYYAYNKPVAAKLRVNKIDGSTKEHIKDNSAIFKLYDITNKKYISLSYTTPSGIEHIDEFPTNSEGYVMMYQNIPYGTYQLEEIKAPSTYSVGTPVKFTVKRTGVEYYNNSTKSWEKAKDYMDLNDNHIYDIDYINYKSYGYINICKTGDIYGYTEYKDTSYVVDNEINTTKMGYGKLSAAPIKNVKFQIYDEDNNLIADIVTDEKGYAVSSKLVADKKYIIKEISTQSGLVLSELSYEVYLEAGEENVNVTKNISVHNDGVTNTIKLYKVGVHTNEEGEIEEAPLRNVLFGLYTNQTFLDENDNVLIKKETLVGLARTDEEGIVAFSGNYLDGEYYIKELDAPEGYSLIDDIYEFKLYAGNNVENIIELYKDSPIKNYKNIVLSETDTPEEKKLGIYDNYNIIMLTSVGVFLIFSAISIVLLDKYKSRDRHNPNEAILKDINKTIPRRNKKRLSKLDILNILWKH